ncbi:MAG: RiPP maturation radical SAM C-methyltransferase [Nitrospirales bacterium]|nr:RiPP maturation radical SAM C-methyltransferase [Nitrospira sp.]MDR4501199.1 RiPP maturation radical SAM C-methyltransferase [Nitrospirales bacterium]
MADIDLADRPSLIQVDSTASPRTSTASNTDDVDFRAYGTKVALVTMPFTYSKFPSIQLGTLSALLKAQGIGVKTYHLNLEFAHVIGVPLYEILCEKRGLIGEWLFSSILFRDNPKHVQYPRDFKPVFEDTAREANCSVGYLEEIAYKIAPQFLTRSMTVYDWDQYDIVGFTSTFDQNVASLTMAKLIKDLYPHIRIVFGGANFDGEMGLEHFRAFPWIDYVVVGEGEESFPPLVKQILTRKEDTIPPGVAHRKDGDIVLTHNTRLFSSFSAMGPPDYDDYFVQLAELEQQGSTGLNRILLYEGSRGCWWGEKHHCTFCGLNAQAMTFRAKPPEQVTDELDYLSSRYETTRFRMVDNIIDMKYIDGLFGKFAEAHLDLDVFMETKSNLTKRQIRTLAQGGVKCMQPGIESMSAAQLKEMDKGVSPLQNIQCLKWSRYYNVDVSWNILLGFPRETNQDYQRQRDLIPSLLHFQPPESTGKLWLERFSPYFMRPQDYGIRILGPDPAYEYVYDEKRVDLSKIAYDFEYEADWNVDETVYGELVQAVNDWRARYFSENRPFLFYSKAISYVIIYDGRQPAPTSERFDQPAAFIIDYCNEQPRTFEQIRQAVQQQVRKDPDDSIISLKEVIALLVSKRILHEEKERYFTLALPVNPHL